MDPNAMITLKIKEDIPTKPINVNIEYTDMAQDEPIFSDTADQHEITEKNSGRAKKKQFAL